MDYFYKFLTKIFFLFIILLMIQVPFWQAFNLFANDDSFFKNKTSIADPFSLRDPFKEPLQDTMKENDLKKGFIKEGVFTNLPSIDNVSLKDLTIIGVLIGKERRAIAEITGGDTVILKEGMFIGKDNAELKAILPGGLVLVEKIINVYGQEEFLETIVPVTERQKKEMK